MLLAESTTLKQFNPTSETPLLRLCTLDLSCEDEADETVRLVRDFT